MKRITALILVIALSASLVGCKSKEEKELERAREAAAAMEEVAKQAQQDYDDLMRDIENYERAFERVQNAE